MKTSKVKSAIELFFRGIVENKSQKVQKDIDSLLTGGTSFNDPKIVKLQDSIETIERQYDYDNWLAVSTKSLVNQVTLATHISKGIHTMSGGDSILFKNTHSLPSNLAGSHNTQTDVIDITGNALALQLYNFININIDEGITLKDLIKAGDQELLEALHDDKKIAQSYLEAYQNLLHRPITDPVTSDLNKQMLFPINGDSLDDLGDIERLEYINVVPLFASVYCHDVKIKIDGIRFSEDNQQARKNRYTTDDKACDHNAYQSIRDLAVLKLGGSNPANVSKVVVMTGGEVILLPSCPPSSAIKESMTLSKRITSFFSSYSLYKLTHSTFTDLNNLYKRYDKQPNADHKTQVKNTSEFLITLLFDEALALQKNKAGWLADHTLIIHEKFWLDPNRGLIAGQEHYAQKRLATDWQLKVINSMAHYITKTLKDGSQEDRFDSYFFDEICIQIKEVIQKYKRAGIEVFYE